MRMATFHPVQCLAAQALRNDEIHRASENLSVGEAENPFGSAVPVVHDAHPVANQDRIRRTIENSHRKVPRQLRHRNSDDVIRLRCAPISFCSLRRAQGFGVRDDEQGTLVITQYT